VPAPAHFFSLLYKSPSPGFPGDLTKTFTHQPAQNRIGRNRLHTGSASEFCKKKTLPARLAACFNLGGDQTNLVYACGMRNVNDISDIGKRNIVVALDEHHLLGAGLENIR
jgi:hypothetical protein